MYKVILFSGLLLMFFIGAFAQQRVVAECTIVYNVVNDSTANTQDNIALKNSQKIVFIKGNDSRTELISPTFTQSVIYDKSTGEVVVLREFGSNKVITKLTKTQWEEKNKKYEGYSINTTNETKTILGYECKKAILQTKDGLQSIIYYAATIVPSVKEFEYQFKDVPGFVLAYELNDGTKKISYIATKINLSPVQSSKFAIPTTGYRVLN